MIFQIQISDQANKDLRNIFEYIALDLQAPESASGLLERLEEAIYGLDQMPERFRSYEKEPWKSRNLRIRPVENYCIFYITNLEKDLVTIIRVMYSGRDTDNQLKKSWDNIREEEADEWDLQMLKEIEDDPECNEFSNL